MSEDSHHTNYTKIWAILVVLLAISVLGPMLEIQVVTLVTAFGIVLSSFSKSQQGQRKSRVVYLQKGNQIRF